jgi:hypothetical protein
MHLEELASVQLRCPWLIGLMCTRLVQRLELTAILWLTPRVASHNYT